MNCQDRYLYSVSLATSAHREAEKQASQHHCAAKYKQVYRNYLARFAVDFYLQILGIATSWEESESNDLLWRSLLNISDLVSLDRGKIECIPIPADSEYIEIPPEIFKDRTAYVFVELSGSLTEANILGFLPQLSRETVYFEDLESLDYFPEYLERLAQSKLANLADVKRQVITETTGSILRLSRWLEERVSEEITALWNPELESAFRKVITDYSPPPPVQNTAILKQFLLDEIKNCRNLNSLLEYSQRLHKIDPQHPQVIDSLVTIIESASDATLKWNAALFLGEVDPKHFLKAVCYFRIVDVGDRSVRLRLAIGQYSLDNYLILIGVYPLDSDRCLPSQLQLQILDDADNLVIVDRDTNKGYLQVQIDGRSGENFSIKLTLDRWEIREYLSI